MTIQEGDFISIDFTGFTEDKNVFDTTKQSIATKHNLGGKNVQFAPIRICVGKGFVLEGIEKALIGKKIGESFTITLSPENAFGKKRADMLKLMPLKTFEKQKIRPVVGLELNIDGTHGTVKSVTGNRVVVDFNNPLAGQTLTYDVDIKEQITAVAEQAKIIASRVLRFEPNITVENDKAIVKMPFELPKELSQELTSQITSSTTLKECEILVDAKTPNKA